MKMQQVVFAGLLALGMPMSALWADGGHHGKSMSGTQETKESDGHAHTHDDEISAAGRVGLSTNVDRSIKIIALDTMRDETIPVFTGSRRDQHFVIFRAR